MDREQNGPAAVLVDSAAIHLASPERDYEQAITPVLTVAMAGSDPVGNSTLRAMLQQTGLVKNVQEWASLGAVKPRHPDDVPDVVFLDLSSGMAEEFAFAQELSRVRPAVNIIACSTKNETNPDFLLQAMRSGIRDFLQKPYNRVEIGILMHRLSGESGAQPVKSAGTGRLLAVLGTKGGVGTSTVAVNLAVQLARIPNKKILLLDFSRPMGDVAALLDLKPKFQVRDAMENVKRLDATLLSGLLATHKSGLQVLCGATRLEDWQNGSLPVIERIVDVAQQGFDFVVMDLGAFYSQEWERILQAAEVLLVSEADLTGLAKLDKHLRALANLRVGSNQVRLVINRWHRSDDEALAQIENSMKMPVFARLPNNFKQVTEATVRGVPVAKNGDPLAEGFLNIAGQLAGMENTNRRKKSLLGTFFSL
jgi:Flp pilus assembly protein, ATPase CpaE